MAERMLILVRHGQYHDQQGHLAYGRLTALGHQQAKRLAKRLEDYPVSAVYSSTAPRAVDTAAPIVAAFRNVPYRRSRLLLEGIPTLLEGLTRLQRARVPKHRARMDRAFAKYFRATRGDDRCEILVCHGNIIRYLLRRALNDVPNRWWRASVMNCGLSTVVIRSDGSAKILSLNDVGHLPRSMQTLR